MTTRIEEIWGDIGRVADTQPIAEGTYNIRRIDETFPFNVYGGIDGAGFALLAIGISRSPPALKLQSAALDYFRQQRNDGTWLMALRLREQALRGVFGRLSQDLIDAIRSVNDEAELVSLFRERLDLWKQLFDGGTSGRLELHEIKGLMAELMFFEDTVLEAKRSPLEAAAAWVGPTGADQDFQFSDEAVEVKAIGPGSEGVTISSLQQLEAVLPIRLSVRTLRAAAGDDTGAIDLNSLVRRIESAIAPVPDALALFRSRLLAARYVEGPWYDKVHFQALAREDFPVAEGFPRLIQSSVPHGVASATYVLSLDTLRNGN